MCLVTDQISMCICAVWSEPLLFVRGSRWSSPIYTAELIRNGNRHRRIRTYTRHTCPKTFSLMVQLMFFFFFFCFVLFVCFVLFSGMEKVTIRRATPQDKEAVCKIHSNVYEGRDYLPAYYDHFLSSPAMYPAMLLYEGQIVSTCSSLSIYFNRWFLWSHNESTLYITARIQSLVFLFVIVPEKCNASLEVGAQWEQSNEFF